MAWMDYSKEEVRVFHPLCEKGLNGALDRLGLSDTYEVLHHQMTGSLEMDYVIANRRTRKYLCVVEVKRTPSAVNSMRYQYQAASYVENSFTQMEQPFYLLTNLEYTYAFRYDAGRKGVAAQILKPGLKKSAEFKKTAGEAEFLNFLIPHFEELIRAFVANDYEYLCTLERFEKHMAAVAGDHRQWKSSLAVLLYEYIRGAFDGAERGLRWRPAVAYRDDVQLLCREGHSVDFDGIFSYDDVHYMKKYPLPPDFLAELYELGRQNISGESVADVLHLAASKGHEHDGEVPTDSELADIVAVLAKIALGENELTGTICDPAAGSGNLLSAASRVFDIEPGQIMANDINEKLLELLTLRCGLAFPQNICRGNAPTVTALNAAALPDDYFEPVQVIVMNPPYVSGIYSVAQKKPLFDRILAATGENSRLLCGQAGLECVFVELICALAKPGTVCACVLPKTHLTARGPEAVAFRRLLLERFGLDYVFDYPRIGIFEEVIKDTCVIVGHIGRTTERVNFISSTLKIAEIDSHVFERSVRSIENYVNFEPLMYGVDARTASFSELMETSGDGWKLVSREYEDVTEFIGRQYKANEKLLRLGSLDQFKDRFKRGKCNNEGAKELLYINLNDSLYTEVVGCLGELAPGIVNADASNESMDVGSGYCHFLKTEDMSASAVGEVIRTYEKYQREGGRQKKNIKTHEQLTALLQKEQGFAFAPNQVLIPRAIRRHAQIYYTTQETYVSTNFFCLDMRTGQAAQITAAWMTTIFYQLLCEYYQKDQEGARKMERKQLADTYIPRTELLTEDEAAALNALLPTIRFLDFNDIQIRPIDEAWAKILWGSDAEDVLSDAYFYLSMMVKKRRGQ